MYRNGPGIFLKHLPDSDPVHAQLEEFLIDSFKLTIYKPKDCGKL